MALIIFFVKRMPTAAKATIIETEKAVAFKIPEPRFTIAADARERRPAAPAILQTVASPKSRLFQTEPAQQYEPACSIQRHVVEKPSFSETRA